MPSVDGITLILESQFDADVIPEAVVPAGGGHDQRVVDVYVPSHLASQFWISYAIKPTALAPAEAQTKYVFFKLLLDGECIVSWGVGAADKWKGKTMWAFFRGEDQGMGWRTVEKRSFFFRPSGDDQDFDIVAYRARGRRRACREFEDMPPLGDTGFDLINWGRLKEHHPQRFYQYALIDASDEPYTAFRYHVRGGRHVCASPSDHVPSRSSSSSSNSYVSAIDEAPEPIEELQDASQLRRLSYPPTILLAPTSSGTEPNSPVKLDSDSSATSEPDLAVNLLDPEPPTIMEENWTEDTSSVETVIHRRLPVRTPTPLTTHQEAADTPPSSMRRRRGAKLREWFGSASKRRAGGSTSPIHCILSRKGSSLSLS